MPSSLEADARRTRQADMAVDHRNVVGEAVERPEYVRVGLVAAEVEAGRDMERELVAAVRDAAARRPAVLGEHGATVYVTGRSVRGQPTTDNLPGHNAQKPGDVIRYLNGKTIEVLNTDAEGRLILIDAITYAQRLGCTHLVDAATLTGAIVVALGYVNIGAFTNNDAMYARVSSAAKAEGEKMWLMPLDDEYKDLLKSPFADLANIGGRWGEIGAGADDAHADIVAVQFGEIVADEAMQQAEQAASDLEIERSARLTPSQRKTLVQLLQKIYL